MLFWSFYVTMCHCTAAVPKSLFHNDCHNIIILTFCVTEPVIYEWNLLDDVTEDQNNTKGTYTHN